MGGRLGFSVSAHRSPSCRRRSAVTVVADAEERVLGVLAARHFGAERIIATFSWCRHLHGGPAPVRRFLPEHVELIGSGAAEPGTVFDLTLPLDEVAEGYRAMDERRAATTLLRI